MAAAALAYAQPSTLELDPAQTHVEFTISDVLHTVHGSFRLKHGELRFDPATGAIGGSVVVDAASGDSGSKTRDHRMSETILECQRYPEISFRPTTLQGRLAAEGTSKVELLGWFGLHGGEHEMAVPAVVSIAGDRLTADLEFTVPYVAWGLKDPSTFLLRVSKQVRIRLHAAGQVKRLGVPGGANAGSKP